MFYYERKRGNGMEQFSLKTEIIIGGADLKELLKDIQRVFIVTDGFMAESGKISYVTKQLEDAGITYGVFSEVRADPDIATVAKGMEQMETLEPQAVIAFGGGSPIDAAKAMVFFAQKQKTETECRFIAIPTTSGTGSEVSRFAVISDPLKEAKYPLTDDALRADIAVLDASLTLSVPPGVTADTGIDVLTHAMEAFVSETANDFTDAAAEKAIRMVHENLLEVFLHPDNRYARQKMHNASCLAGIAFSSGGLGINHSMAHTLGAHFHLPHGKVNGILMPYVISYNSGYREGLNKAAGRYALIARMMGVENSDCRQSVFNLIRLIRQYRKQLNIPNTIAEAGVTPDEFEESLREMAQAACADGCTKTNPRKCTADDLVGIFRNAYDGRL